ncbi:hypothetical protein MYX75_02240 [Acidobacteria bacterium AH-259-A15]|nr:hypothetical protein [Acidobacteria bacterium AH-259-A15]
MSWLLDQFFGRKLEKETDACLRQLRLACVLSSRSKAAELINDWRQKEGPKITLGHAEWGDPVAVPGGNLIGGHALVTGGTGAGKTMFALLIIKALTGLLPQEKTIGFGLIDPKRDLFDRTLFLLAKRLESLVEQDPRAARELRRRIVIYDFSSRNPLSSYNILARWPNVEPDFFAFNRADLLLDLLAGSDRLSLGGIAVLRKVMLLLSEFGLPITCVDRVVEDEWFRNDLLARSRNESVKTYFRKHFLNVPKPTVAALLRRIDALFASEGVRLSLSGTTTPDFRRFQDEGKIVLVNLFGHNIARGVRRLLQGLILSDIRQAVFVRRNTEEPYLWICDEAQNFFLTENLRDNMTDLLTMSRSFGSHFLYLTQNMSTAVQDSRILKVLYTNLRWSFSMRGEPGDCAFLKPALPVTGRKLRPQADPFAEKTFLSMTEERAQTLDAIAHLPDRVGYLWLKSLSNEAIKLRTGDIDLPSGGDLQQAIRQIKSDPGIGMRMSRREYQRLIEKRDQEWAEGVDGDLGGKLEESYRRIRGEAP